MKKSILTLSFLTLFAVAVNAQDTKKTKTTKSTKSEQPSKAETVNPDGTTTPATEPVKETPKKSGTRMAINEKGTSGTIKPKTQKTEEKKNENPVTQPGATKKD